MLTHKTNSIRCLKHIKVRIIKHFNKNYIRMLAAKRYAEWYLAESEFWNKVFEDRLDEDITEYHARLDDNERNGVFEVYTQDAKGNLVINKVKSE